MRNKLLLTVLLLQSVTAYADETKYYGYLGSCAAAIYKFDFKGGKYSVFGVYRWKVNDVPQNQYFVSRGKLTKLSVNQYKTIPDDDKPAAILSVAKDGTIEGKSPDNSSFYFSLCEPKQALALIKEVTSHTK